MFHIFMNDKMQFDLHLLKIRNDCKQLTLLRAIANICTHIFLQVWFQNARAKEKRARSLSSDSAEREQAELSAGAGERDRA